MLSFYTPVIFFAKIDTKRNGSSENRVPIDGGKRYFFQQLKFPFLPLHIKVHKN